MKEKNNFTISRDAGKIILQRIFIHDKDMCHTRNGTFSV